MSTPIDKIYFWLYYIKKGKNYSATIKQKQKEIIMQNISSLREILEKNYPNHNFKWRGNDSRLIGLCPEHEDHNASFNIFEYNGKPYYKCFSCDFKGSIYDFTNSELTPEQKEIYINNKKTQTLLADWFKESKDYLFNGDTVESVFARKYLTETRFLDLEKIKKCDIGLVKSSYNYSEIDNLLENSTSGKTHNISNYSGYLVFAHTDITGNICLLKFRSPDNNKDFRTAKIKGFDKNPSAFNLQLIGKADKGIYPITPYIYITEGEFNSLTYISQTNNYNILSAGSKDNIRRELIQTILQLKYKPIIALDQDAAGQNRLKKLYHEIKNQKQIIYCKHEEKDFDDLFKNKTEDGVNYAIENIKYYEIGDYEQDIFKEQIQREIELEKSINSLILSKSLQDIYLKQNNIQPLYSQCFYNIPVDIFSKITDEEIFGIKMQYPAIFALAGSTGTGKTEFALELADKVAELENHVSIYYQYEGSEIDLLIRAKRKNINNPNFFYFTLANFEKIEKDIVKFADKKIFIVIDYYQLFARFLQSKDDNKNDSVRPYMSKIFFFFTEINKKYNNVCVCLLSSLSNDTIKKLPSQKAAELDTMLILSGLKEDGDIAYNMDYVYSLMFAEENEINEDKYSILKYNKDRGAYREFMAILPAKYSRLGKQTKESFYQFNIKTNRYTRVLFEA